METFSRKVIGSRVSDLKYLIESSLEQKISRDFFQSQMLLNGHNLCDLMMKNFKNVVQALGWRRKK